MTEQRFWDTTPLLEMSREQWESLCDRCGKCCLLKLEDVDSGQVAYTDVVCRYYDDDRCACSVYEIRSRKVPSCVTLTPENIDGIDWMPATCAYRLLKENKPLPEWHHLISGRSDTVCSSGESVCGRCVSERFVHEQELVERIIWVEPG